VREEGEKEGHRASPDHCGDEQGKMICLTLLWRCMDYGLAEWVGQ
jgi:hypothetical protein